MRHTIKLRGLVIGQLLASGLTASVARAQDSTNAAPTPPAAGTSAPGATQTAPADGKIEEDNVNNARAKALAGSKSPWSGQLQFTYLGSTLNHPFSDQAANPSHQAEPPPVYLQGVVAVRYRFSESVTAGLGLGLQTQTPLQGQKHTTASDPQIDVAKSFSLGPIHNRVDFTLEQYTSFYEYTQDGLRQNFDFTSESFYEWEWGGTLGLALEYDYNTVSNHVSPPSGATDQDMIEGQLTQDYLIMPYAEYAFNDQWSLRTIVHFTTNQLRGQAQGKWSHPDATQNFGIGYSPTKAVFLYLFGASDPYAKGTKLAADTTTVGLQAIVNLF